jgi:TolB-like protein
MTKASNTQTVCIAVLPFENLSDNRDHDYFSRGFVEDLITDL